MTSINKRYQIKNNDFSEYKEKFLARQQVNKAVKKGDLKKPSCCQMCNNEDELQAHHIDYSRPLHVYWLCRPCHGRAHHKNSLLNPKNQKRGAVISTTETCNATIATSVSFDVFVLIKKIADDNGTTVSALLRNALIEHYKIDHSQIDFIRDGYDRKEELLYKNAPNRVQNLVVDEDGVLKRESERILEIRRQGSDYLPGMEQLFQAVC